MTTKPSTTFSRRDEGEQMRLDAGVASGMEDALASSLSGSFKIPAPTPKPKNDLSSSEPNAATDTSAPAPHATQEEPIPGMDEWKSTYESYLSSWQAESAEARAKAIKNRQAIEAENKEKLDKELKRRKDEEKERKAEEKKKADEERLRAELEGGPSSSKGMTGQSAKKGSASGKVEKESERDSKIKEAWELVGKGEEDKEIETDGRGVMGEDEEGGQAISPGHIRPHIKQTAYDPTTSTEPLPPFMRDDPPPTTYDKPSEAATQSRQNATSQAWEKVSASSTPQSSPEDLSPPGSGSGLSGEDMMSVPRSKNVVGKEMTDPVPKDITPSGLSSKDTQSTSTEPASSPNEKSVPQAKSAPQAQAQAQPPQAASGSHNSPPAQPPSLTLSLFTDSSRISVSRIVAVMGINLVLPFINGIMLGFGEIFAREAIQVGKQWWREGRSLFGSSTRPGVRQTGGEGWTDEGVERSYGAARGVASVGLSGSGGFP